MRHAGFFSGSSSTRSAVETTKTVSRPRREQPRDVATRDAVSAHDADDDRVIQHLGKGQLSVHK
jgi:hypothetical protein